MCGHNTPYLLNPTPQFSELRKCGCIKIRKRLDIVGIKRTPEPDCVPYQGGTILKRVGGMCVLTGFRDELYN